MDSQSLRISEIEAIERFARHVEQKMQYDLSALKLIDSLAVHQAWIETLETEVLRLKGKSIEEGPTR